MNRLPGEISAERGAILDLVATKSRTLRSKAEDGPNADSYAYAAQVLDALHSDLSAGIHEPDEETDA